MDARFVAWTRPRSDLEAAFEDVAPHRLQSPAMRVAEAAALSRVATGFLDRFAAVERRRLLREQEALDPQYEDSWRDLVRRSRACRPG